MVMRRKPVEEIGPDPGIVESSQSIVKLAAQDVVFNAMFLSIAQQIHQRGATMESDFGSWLSNDAKSWSLTSECLSAIEQWASNPQSAVKMSGSVQQLQKIINQCFIWMCGKLGPVDTDKILHRAIRVAEDLPESVEFPPKKLM